MIKWSIFGWVSALAFAGTGANSSQTSPSVLCDEAAIYASERTGVPLSILRAVTLAETGQSKSDHGTLSPWPWAVQAQKKGRWFPNAQSAIAYVNDLTAKDVSNIDIGCFQINVYWHSSAFQNIEAMFQPKTNALYAASFLAKLFEQTGDWRSAVGRYHSRDLVRAETYLERLEGLYNGRVAQSVPQSAPMDQTLPSLEASAAPPRITRFGLVAARGRLIEFPNNARPIIGGAP